MRSSTLRMADSSRHSTRHRHAVSSLAQLLPTDPHAAVIVGQTGCGKTVYAAKQCFASTSLKAPIAVSSATSWSCAQRSCITRHIRTVHGSGATLRSMLLTRVKDCMTAFVLCIRSSRVSLVCFLSTIALRPRLSPRRRTCCPSWLLVAATPAPLSGCSLRSITRSGRTSESKRNGLLSFIAKTGTRSRTAFVKTMWSPRERREQRLGTALQGQGMQS